MPVVRSSRQLADVVAEIAASCGIKSSENACAHPYWYLQRDHSAMRSTSAVRRYTCSACGCWGSRFVRRDDPRPTRPYAGPVWAPRPEWAQASEPEVTARPTGSEFFVFNGMSDRGEYYTTVGRRHSARIAEDDRRAQWRR